MQESYVDKLIAQYGECTTARVESGITRFKFGKMQFDYHKEQKILYNFEGIEHYYPLLNSISHPTGLIYIYHDATRIDTLAVDARQMKTNLKFALQQKVFSGERYDFFLSLFRDTYTVIEFFDRIYAYCKQHLISHVYAIHHVKTILQDSANTEDIIIIRGVQMSADYYPKVLHIVREKQAQKKILIKQWKNLSDNEDDCIPPEYNI